jgi:hypothetical protein
VWIGRVGILCVSRAAPIKGASKPLSIKIERRPRVKNRGDENPSSENKKSVGEDLPGCPMDQYGDMDMIQYPTEPVSKSSVLFICKKSWRPSFVKSVTKTLSGLRANAQGNLRKTE